MCGMRCHHAFGTHEPRGKSNGSDIVGPKFKRHAIGHTRCCLFDQIVVEVTEILALCPGNRIDNRPRRCGSINGTARRRMTKWARRLRANMASQSSKAELPKRRHIEALGALHSRPKRC